jgi:hypothetical protein
MTQSPVLHLLHNAALAAGDFGDFVFDIFHTFTRDANFAMTALAYDFLTPIKNSDRRYSEDSLGLNSTW